MWRQIVTGAGGVALAVTAAWALFAVAMRMKLPLVLNGIRRMNRAVLNPRAMKTAGQPGAYASVIHHVGRTTGAHYKTPVVARPTDDGFAIVLPYGTRTDWLQNVLAAETAVIVHDGGTYRVDHPQLRPIAAAHRYFPRREQRSNRLYGIDDVLLVRRAISA